MTTQTVSLEVQNTFTPVLHLGAGTRCAISISGAFTADITLQRRLDGTNWRDVEMWSLPAEVTYIADVKQNIRLGIKTGDYTAGTAVLLIGAG